jgi:hypothetical protein
MLLNDNANATRPQRTGMTLPELMIAFALLAIVGSAIVMFLLRQQRFYAGANELMMMRTQVRQTSAFMPADLRAISSSGNDIYSMTDTSIEFRSAFGTSVVCVNNTGKSPFITIPPLKLAKKSLLTSWTQAPVAGDSLLLYVDSSSTASTDDIWSAHQISANPTAVVGDVNTGCPSTTGLAQAADLVAGNPSYSLTLSPTQSKTVNVTAAVRFFKRVHYSLYQAADGLWYLGYYDCRTGRTPVCNAIQPVAGPLRPYSSANNGAASGLKFTYLDSTGAVTTDRRAVARIRLFIQAQSQNPVQLSGTSAQTFRDSLSIEIGLRNWK